MPERQQHGGCKVTETSVTAFNFPSKQKVITLDFQNIEINTCLDKELFS